LWPDDDALNDEFATTGNLVCELPPNQRLLLPERERLSRRELSWNLVCGGFGTPRSRSAGR